MAAFWRLADLTNGARFCNIGLATVVQQRFTAGNAESNRTVPMTSLATPEVATEAAVSLETGRISLADIAKAHDVRFLLATFVDMTGKPCQAGAR
jgi:hypothetical protein